jgi:hypothetical protein
MMKKHTAFVLLKYAVYRVFSVIITKWDNKYSAHGVMFERINEEDFKITTNIQNTFLKWRVYFSSIFFFALLCIFYFLIFSCIKNQSVW